MSLGARLTLVRVGSVVGFALRFMSIRHVGPVPFTGFLFNLRVAASLKFGDLLKPTNQRDCRAAGVHAGPRMVDMWQTSGGKQQGL